MKTVLSSIIILPFMLIGIIYKLAKYGFAKGKRITNKFIEQQII